MFHGHSLRTPILVSLCLCIVAWAPQAWAGKKTKEEKRQEQEEERSKKEGKKRVEQAKQYATLMEFAEDLYATDPDFRDQVDEAYRELQRRHTREAFRINTSRYSEIVALEGDELNIRRALYDNPRIQDYVNRVGQRLVPADSEKLFAFKVTKDPVPYAYTLSTGTVYISTGLISLTDNEAQLAYVMSHELAHVYKDHWKTKVMGAEAQDEYNKKQVKKRALWGGIIGAGLGAAIGGAAGRSAQAAATGAMLGGMGGLLVGVVTSRKLGVDWEYAQENEADEFGLKNTLDKNYDIQEVPKFYLALKQASAADQRVGLGFIAQSKRVKDRMEYANKDIQGTLQADYQAKLKAGQLVGTSPDYQLMMAELKRDNGVIAFAYDMFGMARQNLRQAVNLRSDDARAHFYYAKVMKLTARNDTEKTLARGELLTAIKLDEDRHAIPEAELQRAVMLMDNPDSSSQAEATQALKNYIVSYQESQVQGWKYSSSLPPNMDILDDYLRLLGEPKWKPPFPELYRVLAPDVVAARTTPGLVPASVPGASQGTASTSVVPAKAESQPKERFATDMLEKARHHALRLCIVGVFLTGGFANALPPQGNSPTFLIEIPDSQVAPTTQAVLNLPSASVQLILIHILRPEADNVDYGQIYPQLNGAAAARICESRPSEQGKLLRLNLKARPGFHLLPGNNTLEILAVNRSGRELRARFLLHIPKGVCSGGGSAKVLSFQRLTDTLRSGVSSERLIQYVLDCGVDFELGAETVEKLQGAGAANKLIEAIRSPTAPEFAEYQSRGLRTQELMTMLQVGMSQDQVIQEVENRGVSFEFTAENDQKLRAAGAGDKLIDAIHYMAGDESALTRPRGLRVSEIVELLEGGVDTNRIFELVRQRGVSFRLDSETEVRFRGAGANEKLMRAIRTAAENYAASH